MVYHIASCKVYKVVGQTVLETKLIKSNKLSNFIAKSNVIKCLR